MCCRLNFHIHIHALSIIESDTESFAALLFNASVNKQLIFSTLPMREWTWKVEKSEPRPSSEKLLNNNQQDKRRDIRWNDLNNCAKKGSSLYALCNSNNGKDLKFCFKNGFFLCFERRFIYDTIDVNNWYAFTTHCLGSWWVQCSASLSLDIAVFKHWGGYLMFLILFFSQFRPLMLIETSSLQRRKIILARMHLLLSPLTLLILSADI